MKTAQFEDRSTRTLFSSRTFNPMTAKLNTAQLKSISGYRRVNNKTYNDRDGTQEDIFSGFEDDPPSPASG